MLIGKLVTHTQKHTNHTGERGRTNNGEQNQNLKDFVYWNFYNNYIIKSCKKI